MSGLFGNTFGNLFGNLFGDNAVTSSVPWTRERRPIRRYTDWNRWTQVATEQLQAMNQLSSLVAIATSMNDPAASALIKVQNNTQWIDIEFARTSDLLDKAEAQVNYVQAAICLLYTSDAADE